MRNANLVLKRQVTLIELKWDDVGVVPAQQARTSKFGVGTRQSAQPLKVIIIVCTFVEVPRKAQLHY